MRDQFLTFWRDEDGAITVDFVVLTAAICTLGFVILVAIGSGAEDLANRIETELDAVSAAPNGGSGT